jgi:DNA-binding MarR family transcriptional regulator
LSLKKGAGFITGLRLICYSVPRLSNAQEKILRHFFECNIVAPESVSHIAESIKLLQPSVHRSVSSLIKNKYLVKDKKAIRSGKGKMSFEKALYVTDKGIAAAIVLGVTIDQLKNYLSKFASKNESAMNSISYLNRFIRLYKVPVRREFLARKTMEYLLNNNCYDNLGRVIYPSAREFRRAYRYVQDEFSESFGASDTVKELLDKYGIDKCFLKEAFQKDRKRMDLILGQLEK